MYCYHAEDQIALHIDYDCKLCINKDSLYSSSNDEPHPHIHFCVTPPAHNTLATINLMHDNVIIHSKKKKLLYTVSCNSSTVLSV